MIDVNAFFPPPDNSEWLSSLQMPESTTSRNSWKLWKANVLHTESMDGFRIFTSCLNMTPLLNLFSRSKRKILFEFCILICVANKYRELSQKHSSSCAGCCTKLSSIKMMNLLPCFYRFWKNSVHRTQDTQITEIHVIFKIQLVNQFYQFSYWFEIDGNHIKEAI